MADFNPKSVADIRTRFTKQTKALQNAAKSKDKAVTEQAQPKQFPLDKNGWNGDVLDPEPMSKPFDRKEHNEDVTKAVTNPDTPGVVGDLAVSTVQGDFLAALERSFRLHHATGVRLRAHATARNYGHGHDAGVLIRGMQTYVTDFLKLSKGT